VTKFKTKILLQIMYRTFYGKCRLSVSSYASELHTSKNGPDVLAHSVQGEQRGLLY